MNLLLGLPIWGYLAIGFAASVLIRILYAYAQDRYNSPVPCIPYKGITPMLVIGILIGTISMPITLSSLSFILAVSFIQSDWAYKPVCKYKPKKKS